MSNGFDMCDKPLHCIHGFKTDCPYCRIDELEQDRDGWIRNFEMQERVVAIAQQRVAELEQQLAGEKKAAGYWMEQSCKDHNRAEKAEQQLSRYQGWVEVEGVISEFGDILLPEPTPMDVGQRVRVLVIKGERE